MAETIQQIGICTRRRSTLKNGYLERMPEKWPTKRVDQEIETEDSIDFKRFKY